MTWTSTYRSSPFTRLVPHAPLESLRANEQCYIRKEHRCGKIYGASKSCFIACPTDDDLEPILELISEKLSKVGVEPIIAVKERAYGQDIFCTKICGKIIEARFCIVILDDTVTDHASIPNPNVYYEYGLMTPLGKHIIPLQKADLKLAFNIQSHDTVKYNSRNIASELDRAIKDAIMITESREKGETTSVPPDKTILRRFEMSGFELKDDKWFLSEVVDDTLFRGFGHPEKRFYLYLCKVDTADEFQAHLEDLDVILYRTERKASELERTLADAIARLDALGIKTFADRERVARELRKVIDDKTSIQELMTMIYVGFVFNSHLDTAGLRKKVEVMVNQYGRYKTSYSSDSQMTIGDVEVMLGSASD